MPSNLELAREYRWNWFPPCSSVVGLSLCNENKNTPCYECDMAEKDLAALIAKVRQEQHEASLMDIWPRLQHSVRTVTMQRIFCPDPPDYKPPHQETP